MQFGHRFPINTKNKMNKKENNNYNKKMMTEYSLKIKSLKCPADDHFMKCQ